MSIVKSTNKKTGITYVYESESYWDPEKKQPRNRRKLIGKLDEAGNVIPTGKKGRARNTSQQLTKDEKKELISNREETDIYRQKLVTAEAEIAELKSKIKTLEKEKEDILRNLEKVLVQYRS